MKKLTLKKSHTKNSRGVKTNKGANLSSILLYSHPSTLGLM